jgi:hypothetical protein
MLVRVTPAKYLLQYWSRVFGPHDGIDPVAHGDRTGELEVPAIAVAKTERTFAREIPE